MISQTIAGALEMYALPLDLLAAKNPACGIFGVGYAFLGYDHIWEAMDGDLVNHLRGIAEQIGFHVVHNCYDHGFRQITTRTKPIEKPEDLKGFKIRLPVAPYFIALFQSLGASPTPINFAEVYSALQTGVVDGQENPLVLIDTAKLYEVQKYCSLTNHIWAGIHISFSNIAWKRLPRDLQELSEKHFNEKALQERDDWQKMTQQEIENLKSKGMVINSPDPKLFQDALRKTTFYKDMKSKSGAIRPGHCSRNRSAIWHDQRRSRAGPAARRCGGAGPGRTAASRPQDRWRDRCVVRGRRCRAGIG